MSTSTLKTTALCAVLTLAAALSACKKTDDATPTNPNGNGNGGDTTNLADKTHFDFVVNLKPTMLSASNTYNLPFGDMNWYNNSLYLYYSTIVSIGGASDLNSGSIVKVSNGQATFAAKGTAPGRMSRFSYLKNDKAFSTEIKTNGNLKQVKFYTNSTNILDKPADYPTSVYDAVYGIGTDLYHHYLAYESYDSYFAKGIGYAATYYLNSWYTPKQFTNPQDSIFGTLGEMAVIGDNGANTLVAYQMARCDVPTQAAGVIGHYLRLTRATNGDFAPVADIKDTLAQHIQEMRFYPTAANKAVLVALCTDRAKNDKLWVLEITNFGTITSNRKFDIPDHDNQYALHYNLGTGVVLAGIADATMGSKPSLYQINLADGTGTWVGSRGFGLLKGSCYGYNLNNTTYTAFPGLVGDMAAWSVAKLK